MDSYIKIAMVECDDSRQLERFLPCKVPVTYDAMPLDETA